MLTDFSRRPPPAFQTRALVLDDHYVGDDDDELDGNDDQDDKYACHVETEYGAKQIMLATGKQL